MKPPSKPFNSSTLERFLLVADYDEIRLLPELSVTHKDRAMGSLLNMMCNDVIIQGHNGVMSVRLVDSLVIGRASSLLADVRHRKALDVQIQIICDSCCTGQNNVFTPCLALITCRKQ
ncbi:hypothetical protein PoB_005408400 [Plakobranchus ocellatus]|uniref:Uncharacterized protein n=1 Tax=Plakobranchus ocellatus TaxID=259542 RepID=A0AAV4C936_9GAST|nr:hypothetical protein PoB_005408400 [Plakobranchus ocellatus]